MNFVVYQIKIDQTEDLAEDIRAKCKNYDRQLSFAKCTELSLNEYFLGKLGCSPPWFINNYSKVCNHSLSRTEIDSIWEASTLSLIFNIRDF